MTSIIRHEWSVYKTILATYIIYLK